jgi:ATP-dependent exoDNAse (exonuclease V) beta subunit
MGFSDLAKQYKDWQKNDSNFEVDDILFELNENEETVQTKNEEEKVLSTHPNTAALRGRIIHKFLQMELGLDDINSFIDSEIKNESPQFEKDILCETTIEGIKSDLKKYLSSDVYKELNAHKNYKNEFEVYVKENDFYLYGIIDKLIIEKDSVQIVDYKTDSISTGEIVLKSEHYLNQLKFYSYIASRLFEKVSEISIRIVFIKHPDSEVFLRIDKEGIVRIKEQITNFVNITRRGIYGKNLMHCASCNFSINNGKCVKRIG